MMASGAHSAWKGRKDPRPHTISLTTKMAQFTKGGSFFGLIGGLSGVIRAKSHDSRESGDSRESEIRVIRANRPDAL